MAKQIRAEPAPDPWRQWHRLFGLLLTDHLAGSPFTVELEKDLSKKQQLLDVVIVRRGRGEATRPLPDRRFRRPPRRLSRHRPSTSED